MGTPNQGFLDLGKPQTLALHFAGGSSDTVSFTTNSCEPDTPFPPKKITCTKTSINLRWNAPTDNGGHIKEYLLEFDGGMGTRSPFVECFKGRAKSFNVGKLQSQTLYRFRLCAVSVIHYVEEFPPFDLARL